MKQFLRDYFSFNKRERNGILVLVLLLVALIFALMIQQHRFSMDSPELVQVRKLELPVVTPKSKPGKDFTGKEPEALIEKEPRAVFDFDPNTLDEAGWLRLGLKPKQVRTIRNYLEKGGHFRSAEDLKKMYGIREETWLPLLDHVKIKEVSKKPDTLFERKRIKQDSLVKKRVQQILDLNLADSAGLEGLRCIGPGFAKRIIAYRNALGGFHTLEQLKEVYGMDEERYRCVLSQVKLTTGIFHSLDINRAETEELRKHPYIRWNLAKLIVSYRNQHGMYKNVEDLRNLKLMEEEVFLKLKPYLRVD